MSRLPLSAAGVAVLCFGVAAMAGAEDEKKTKAEHKHHQMEKCAKACFACARECESCATHCARQVAAGKKEHLRTLNTCRDCAEFCAAAGRISARGGPMAALMCDACAKACDVCAAACEKFEDDDHMKACAKACRDCAKECREMIQHTAKPSGS